jgi:hypothetical protein
MLKAVLTIAALVVLGAIFLSGTLPKRDYDPLNLPADLSTWGRS